jgi:NDP-sugar pyrophosphorylase family protein
VLTEVIILCGGAGLRLRPVTGTGPKSMANISGRPFIEILVDQLAGFGFRRIILAIGYEGAAIRSYFGDVFRGVDVAYSNELSPLGTGGALRNAVPQVGSISCLVMNGDSYTDVNLRKFAAAHHDLAPDASVVVVPVDERGDAGSVVIDAAANVVQFAEKERPSLAKHLNAGIYMLSRDLMLRIPEGLPLSLERDLFPEWIREGRAVKAFVHPGKCVDIGTPERYRAAQNIFAGATIGAKSNGEEDHKA